MDKNKFKELQKQLEKDFGKGSIMNLGDKESLNIESFSSGSLLLDEAIGVGGYPRGRIIEIFGPESSGKTTLSLHAIREIQQQGGTAAFIDAEHSIDISFAKKIGVNVNELIISQPDSGEQALEIASALISSDSIDLVVIDSVAALVPLAELNGAMEDQTIGAQARLMSKSMRKLSGIINKTNTTLIFINQIREKTGVIFGSPEITPGGRALKFFASLRIDIRLKERIVENGVQIGQLVKIKIIKNKVATPFKIIETEIYYDKGIDKNIELLELSVQKEIINKAGPWYSYGEIKLGKGKKASTDFLLQNPKMIKELKEKIF